MSYSTPRTWSSGEKPTSAQMNQDLRDNVAFLANPPHCGLTHSATQTHTNNNNWQALVFDTEQEDTASLHSTSSNTSRITVPVAGLYIISAGVLFATNANGLRAFGLRKNGSGTGAANIKGRAQTSSVLNGDAILSLATVVKLAANDYIEAVAYQSSGGNLGMGASAGEAYPYFTATWKGLG